MDGVSVINEGSVKGVVDKLAGVLRLDGGDLILKELDGQTGVVRLRLVLDDVSCADCVLPAAHIADLALRWLQEQQAGVVRVLVDDPREPAGMS
jgi:Fe-S cluster biogenesis protein NfuA